MPTQATLQKIEIISKVMLVKWKERVRHPFDSLIGIKCLASEFNCEIWAIDEGVSSYCPIDGRDGPAGKISLYMQQEPVWVIRDGIHELSHHTLHHWEYFWPWPWTFPGEEHLKDDIEEAICDCVANHVWPIPEGFQANGKQAVPDLPGVVARCGWHNPAPACMAMPAAEIKRHDEEQDSLLSLFLQVKANLNSHD